MLSPPWFLPDGDTLSCLLTEPIVGDVELWLWMLATSWRVLVGDVAVVGDGKNWKLAGKEPLGQP